MGWRALRLSLDRSTLMKAQARALIEASAGRVLRVMFPMVSEPWEYEEARALFEEQIEWAAEVASGGCRRGSSMARCSKCRASPKCSTMLLPRIDFLSIGTNDLTQFLFAADRADPRLAERYDWLSPAILRFLKRVARCRPSAAGVPVARVRRDGRPAAGGDGADRHRRRAISRSPRRRSARSRRWSARSTRPRSRAQGRRSCSPSRRANMRKALADWARRHAVAIG